MIPPTAFLSSITGIRAVAEVELERAAGLQALREQGGRAGLDRVRGD